MCRRSRHFVFSNGLRVFMNLKECRSRAAGFFSRRRTERSLLSHCLLSIAARPSLKIARTQLAVGSKICAFCQHSRRRIAARYFFQWARARNHKRNAGPATPRLSEAADTKLQSRHRYRQPAEGAQSSQGESALFLSGRLPQRHDNLKQVEPIEGAKILNPVIGSARNSKCYVPLFFPSAAGGQSFQPKDPGQGVSLFGRALLEGLRGTNLRLDCDERRCLVNLDPLLGYCKERVLSIARESFHEEVDQEVSLSGDYVRDPVTQLPPPQPPPLVLGLKPLVRSAGTEARQFTEILFRRIGARARTPSLTESSAAKRSPNRLPTFVWSPFLMGPHCSRARIS